MIAWRTRTLAGLLVLLVGAPEAIPQTPQSGPSTRQMVARKMGKSGNEGTLPATGATSEAMPSLCFQPGVGWQRTLPEPSRLRTTPGINGSTALEVSRPISGAHAHSIDGRPSSAEQEYAAGCGGDSINKKAPGTGAEQVTIRNHPRTLRSAGPMKPGPVTTFHGNSLYPAPRNTGIDPVGIANGPAYFASEAESDAHPNQVGARAFHAYTSSIKLRRLIRNAPDFRTRIKLQQLQTNRQIHPKTGAAARGILKHERAKQTSSRRSDTHDRPRDNPLKPASGAYR
jgi:hypothetical protein